MAKKDRKKNKLPQLPVGFSHSDSHSNAKTPTGFNPRDSAPKMGENHNAYLHQTPVWQIGKIDNESKWGWSSIGHARWKNDILPHLVSRESMTWKEIEAQTGKNHSSSHDIPISSLCRDAQKRLKELQRDDYDDIYSLRVSGKVRIFGQRQGRVFQIFWFDFEHEICPSKKKNT